MLLQESDRVSNRSKQHLHRSLAAATRPIQADLTLQSLSLQEKLLRQQKKAKLAARTKLSFAQDDEGDEDAEENGAAKVLERDLH